MNSTVKQVITWVVLAVAAIVLWQVVKNGTSGPKERDITLTVEVSQLRGGAPIRGHAGVSQREDVDRVAVNAVALAVVDVHVIERHI